MENKFLWGMNLHNTRNYASYPERNNEKHMELCAELGMNMIRFNFNPRTPEDFEYLDRVLALSEAKNLEFMLCLDHRGLNREPEEFKKIANHYKGRIKYYNLMNEMDLYCLDRNAYSVMDGCNDGQSKENYIFEKMEPVAKTLKMMAETFRKYDPEAKLVLNIAWVHHGILDYFINDAKIDCDMLGVNWYSGEEDTNHKDFRMQIDGLFDLLHSNYPNHELILTETNIRPYCKINPIHSTEEDQADFNVKFMEKVYKLSLEKPYIKGMIFYELLDQPAKEVKKGEYDSEAHYGFVKCTPNGDEMEPKKTYYAVKDKIARL